MAELGMFFNGGTNFELKRSDNGHLIPDASVREIHQESRTTMKEGVEQAIMAEELGFSNVTFTEHHFQIGGAEHSPNPLQAQTYIAAKTDNIQLRQVANIIVWHDPIRLAEQVAMLDNLSGGRVEFGIGRGYQPRENEVLGQYWGGTIQDEEKNRQSLEEKLTIIKKAWTNDLINHKGEFHHVPPVYTKWHHKQDFEYLNDDVSGVDVDEVMEWDYDADDREGDHFSQQDGDSTLKKVGVLPHPHQEPHPPMWEPVGSPRSIRFAAENAINAYLTTGPPEVVAEFAEQYYDAVEEAGWPDYREEYDGSPFKYGWDGDRRRGLCTRRPVFITDAADDETYEAWKRNIEFEWGWYEPFDTYTPELLSKHTGDDRWYDHEKLGHDPELVIEHEIAMVGTAEEIVEKIINMKELVGYEDDFCMDFEFGARGLSEDVTIEQMKAFGEKVIPHVEEEFPG